MPAQNASLTLLHRIEEVQQTLEQTQEAIEEKKTSLASLDARKQGVVSGVQDGADRSLKASKSLRNAEAHQALRASLLLEKQELISHLQEELGQVGPKAFAGLKWLVAVRQCAARDQFSKFLPAF